MTHELKTLRRFFTALADGRKTFEMRQEADRSFCEGDTIHLQEWEPSVLAYSDGNYTGRELFFEVTYCLREHPFVPQGYVCMGIKRIEEPTE